jgi:TonB family protein
MKNIILILAFIITSAIVFSQNKEANKNYELGNHYFAENDFQKAVEYYSFSIEQIPAADAYFNRALSYFKLFDSCNYCKDMQMAFMFGDKQAEGIFKKKCVKYDTIYSTEDSIREEFPGYSYTLKKIQKCSTDTLSEQYDANHKRITSIYEKLPVFPGGEMAQSRFLAANIVYPQIAKENGIQGTIYISFNVEINGKISDIKILKGIGGECDKEALRVVRLMTKWTPGTRKGVPIKSNLKMPIRFTLN